MKLDTVCRDVLMSTLTMVGMQLLTIFGEGQLLASLTSEDIPMRYELQRVFGMNLADPSTAGLFPRRVEREELEPTAKVIAQEWAGIFQEDEKYDRLKTEVTQIVQYWSKSSVCLIGYRQLFSAVLQRFDKELHSEPIRCTELYSLACLLSSMASNMDLRLNLGRMDYDDLCEVNFMATLRS